MALTYYVLDVFTERPFGGNPLAVVVDADNLSSADMQTIAREFNLSETVFVLTPTSAGHTARIRIFTPSRELAFAGHPTLGAAVLLAELRAPLLNGERDAIIALEEEIGSVRVGVRLRSQAAAYGEFDAPKATGTLERCARACIAGMRSVVMCETSSGWIAMMTGAFFSSLMSMIPVNIAQSLMLKAGMAKLWAFATSRMDLPV